MALTPALKGNCGAEIGELEEMVVRPAQLISNDVRGASEGGEYRSPYAALLEITDGGTNLTVAGDDDGMLDILR
jgi:hypothetical protein